MSSTSLLKQKEALHPEHHRYYLFENFRDDLNQLFDHLLPQPMAGSSLTQGHDHLIRIDLKDTGKSIELTAEMPGVELTDINLAVTPHYVSISGEKREVRSEHHKHHYRAERSFGFFRRVIPLPCEIEKDRADAVYKDGVVHMTLPKTQSAIADEKKVSIKAG